MPAGLQPHTGCQSSQFSNRSPGTDLMPSSLARSVSSTTLRSLVVRLLPPHSTQFRRASGILVVAHHSDGPSPDLFPPGGVRELKNRGQCTPDVFRVRRGLRAGLHSCAVSPARFQTTAPSSISGRVRSRDRCRARPQRGQRGSVRELKNRVQSTPKGFRGPFQSLSARADARSPADAESPPTSLDRPLPVSASASNAASTSATGKTGGTVTLGQRRRRTDGRSSIDTRFESAYGPTKV